MTARKNFKNRDSERHFDSFLSCCVKGPDLLLEITSTRCGEILSHIPDAKACDDDCITS